MLFYYCQCARVYHTRRKTEWKFRKCIGYSLDYLAAGIEPKLSAIFIQSEIPAIAELTFLFSMLLPYPRVMRNPTLKEEIRVKNLGDNYPFGFLLYAVGQV